MGYRLLTRFETNRYFERCSKLDCEKLKFRTLSVIYINKKFIVCKYLNGVLEILTVIKVEEMRLNSEGMNVMLRDLKTGILQRVTYVPAKLYGYKDIIVSIPNHFLLTKEVYIDRATEDPRLNQYRVTGGLMFKQRSDPANKKPYVSLVEKERMESIYGLKKYMDTYDAWIKSIT